MYISLDWINELVNLESIKLNKLIDKLILSGFEVEETLKLTINGRKKIMLDISTTANRADSLSIRGIAKEISALVDKPIKNVKYIDTDSKYIQCFQENLINSKKKLLVRHLLGLQLKISTM